MIRRWVCFPVLLAAFPCAAFAASASSYERVILPDAGSYTTTLAVADFDGDANLDVVTACHFPPKAITLYRGDGMGGFAAPEVISEGVSDRIFSAYVNADEHPDLIAARFMTGDMAVYLNNGDGTFGEPVVTPVGILSALGLATGHLNDDEHLDLVLFASNVQVYFGDGTGAFTLASTIPGVTSANGGGIFDCNSDGIADVVVFAGKSVGLFIGDGAGGFVLSDLVSFSSPSGVAWGPQAMPGEGIIDFNEDGHPDVLVAEAVPPSEGPSFAHVLFTDGNGQFSGQTTVSVLGRCEGLTALDYNYDGHLDIAAGSTVESRIHVFLGDGSGGITDSLSFSSGTTGAITLYAADFKEDGLWDFVAGDVEGDAAVFTDLAEAPAPVVVGDLEVRASQSVRLRVLNPRDLAVEQLGYHIPSAKIHRRDANQDGSIEDVFKDVTLHDGDYVAHVYPASNAAPGSLYSLTGEIAGVPLQFARNAIIPAAGNTYPILVFSGSTNRVSPQTGSFTPNTTPTFDWGVDAYRYKGAAAYTFEIDDNYDFSSPVHVVMGLYEPRYTLPEPLAADTLYYWRYRPYGVEGGEYSTVFAINITNCECAWQGDFDADFGVDAVDLARLIDVVFFGGEDIQDATCFSPRGDFDCSGVANAVDLALVIDHVFFGGAGPCDPCQ